VDPKSLEVAAALWRLGLLRSDEITGIAYRALESGHDSLSLRILAGETEPILSTVGPLFERALEEVGVPVPSAEDAGRAVARHFASAIVAGTLGPVEGARRIWWDVFGHREIFGTPLSTELAPFVALADEHDDFVSMAVGANVARYETLARGCIDEIGVLARQLAATGRLA
jgi:hypothetical protein